MQSDPMLSQALQQNKTYEDEINQADNTALSQAPSEVRDKMNQFRMNEEFADEAACLALPPIYAGDRPQPVFGSL